MDRRKNDISDEAPDTCRWLLDHEQYKTWLARSQALLWIEGKPGAGKSTLLAYAVRQPPQSNDIVASFFFSARGAPIQQTSLGMFRSLLHQLLEKSPEMLSKFSLMYQKKRDTKLGSGQILEWHERELRDFLDSYTTILPEAHPIRIYVDALDESGQDVAIELVNYFQKLTSRPSSTKAGISVCFSCRHYPVLAPFHELNICVEDENHEDIGTHVRTSLRGKFPDKEDALDLERNIVEKASGVFQWVILVIRIILKLNDDGANLRKIHQKIEELPDKLEDLYKDVLSKIEDRARAVQLMQWVCFAQRPLLLKELRFAMVIDATTSYTSLKQCQSSADFSDTDEQMKRTVTSLSGGLAETRDYQDSQTVQFIHQSVKDYLVRSGLPNLDSSLSDNVIGRSHFRLSRSCVKFLTLEEVLRLRTENLWYDYRSHRVKASKKELKNLFPLLNYPATNWIAHAEAVEAQRMPQDDLLELFRWPSDDIIKYCTRYCNLIKPHTNLVEAEITFLHVASSHGLLSVIAAMIKSGEAFDVNSKDGKGRTPLSWAAECGKEAVVQLLINQGAEIDSKDNEGQTPLSWAAKCGKEAVVQLLIELRAEVESKDNKGRTPLSWAADYGQAWAADYEKQAVVRLLIKRGAEVDSKDKRGQTPLSHAAHFGTEAVVQLLIELRAEVDSKDNRGRTPLSWAASWEHEAIVRLLIKQGAEVDSKDNMGRTPLSWAADNGETATVQFLIEQGAEVESKDKRGQTPLSWAVEHGQISTVELLIEHGAEVDSKDNTGRTPLSWVAETGHENMVQFLIERDDVDINSRDRSGRTPLAVARNGFMLGCGPVAEMLARAITASSTKSPPFHNTS
ncbi:hypothetical protein JMJ35_010586 [Cladonia borealis]|uniref:Uncharacterized protein n=1 Tax=Cladonia borealis TaxID=184061 RepID=A0AA39QS37_9LECA|nr:hypothetical protein JMJ35_010586 [Cladonia borealis]